MAEFPMLRTRSKSRFVQLQVTGLGSATLRAVYRLTYFKTMTVPKSSHVCLDGKR